MKICFDTFGCRLNRAEALEDEARYLADGWEMVSSHQEADAIVVRGCSVTGKAQRECERLIEHLRRKYPGKQLIVKGCLKEAKKETEAPASAAVPTRTARAYLKVQDGCSGRCSFCIVPQFRGKSVSVGFDAVLDRAKRFIDAGYHELVVTGCNLSLYASGGRRLPELLSALAELDGGCRTRLGSLEPSAVAEETVAVIAAHDNLCRFLHIPVQSGSDRILTAMRRPYRIHEVDQLIDSAEKMIPKLGLGCDLITGFPGETDNDHLATLGFVKRHSFSNSHVFPYSVRPGTLAAALPHPVPRELAKERAAELTKLTAKKRRQFIDSLKGSALEIVIEDERRSAGWTSEYVWCEVIPSTDRSAAIPRRKELVRVNARFSNGTKLKGVQL